MTGQFQPMWKVGQVFETAFEGGCIMLTLPDPYGNFVALDSDGNEYECNVVMILPTNGSDAGSADYLDDIY